MTIYEPEVKAILKDQPEEASPQLCRLVCEAKDWGYEEDLELEARVSERLRDGITAEEAINVVLEEL
jgi:hypothetical protein